MGKEMKAIHDDPNQRGSREMFVLCMRFMMWGFELQKEHCRVNNGHLQDMHFKNCVFMDGFSCWAEHTGRCVDSNGWWNIGTSRWKDLYSLSGCIFDVIETDEWRLCCNLHPVHVASVRNVSLNEMLFYISFFW